MSAAKRQSRTPAREPGFFAAGEEVPHEQQPCVYELFTRKQLQTKPIGKRAKICNRLELHERLAELLRESLAPEGFAELEEFSSELFRLVRIRRLTFGHEALPLVYGAAAHNDAEMYGLLCRETRSKRWLLAQVDALRKRLYLRVRNGRIAEAR